MGAAFIMLTCHDALADLLYFFKEAKNDFKQMAPIKYKMLDVDVSLYNIYYYIMLYIELDY